MKSYCLLIADEMDGEVDFDLPGKVFLPAVSSCSNTGTKTIKDYSYLMSWKKV